MLGPVKMLCGRDIADASVQDVAFESFPYDLLKQPKVGRLDEVVEGPVFNGFDGVADVAAGCGHDDRHRVVDLFCGGEETDSVHVGKAHVEEYYIGMIFGGMLQSLLRIRCYEQCQVTFGKRLAKHGRERFSVSTVDDKKAAFHIVTPFII